MTDNLEWLVYGGFLTTIVGSVIYFIQKWLGRCWNGMYNAIFQFISRRFDVAELTVQDTGCEKVFGKVLRQLGLDTGRYVYIHEANATAGDRMMVGIVRFPTKSWFLWFLALLEISHFVWIKDNVKHIVYVGPRAGFRVLLQLANTTKNRNLTIEEAERAKLAMKGDSTVLDACIYFERRFTLAVLMIATACWAQSCLR